jgi:hypothetical protein
MRDAAVTPNRVAAASNPCPAGSFLLPRFLATTTDSTPILSGMGALSQTVQIMFYRREEQALIDFRSKDTVIELNLADHLILEIFDL